MADGLGYTEGAGKTVLTDELGAGHAQGVKLVIGADGDNDGFVSAANPLPVEGTLTIGALEAGDNNIGNVDVVSLPAIPAGNNNIGDVDVASIAAGDNNIGNVDIVTMPNVVIGSGTVTTVSTVSSVTAIANALPAGNNNIGDVDIASMPSVTLAASTGTQEVVGDVAHDSPAAGNPVLMGGYAKAAAPSDVSGDADAVNAWFLRNGAQAVNVTAAGALIPGDASNGLDVDVTRLPALVAGSAIIGNVRIDQTTPGTTNAVSAAVTSIVPGTAATSLGKAIDTALGATDTGVLAMGVRDDALATLTEADGDVTVMRTNARGAQWVALDSTAAQTVTLAAGTAAYGKLSANSGVDIGDVDVTSVPTDPFGANADAASATGSISAKLKGIATALGVTAYDLGTGTGGTRTQRVFLDTASTVGLVAGSAAIGKLAANSGVDIGDVDVTSVPTDPFGANADAASVSTSISAKLKGIATALGITALDLGSGTGGSRTLRTYPDTAAVHRTAGFMVTVSTDVTLPTSSIYGINDAISDSTSSPVSGGFTFTNAARVSGGSGVITDAIITTSVDAGTLLQGEIWLFDQAVTNINDNAAFAVSDSEIKTYVGKIPFTLEDAGNNGAYHAQNLGIGFTCVGTANLRFLIKAKNAYTPATDVLTFRLKILQDG
jgi:hypothetical protein